MCESQGQRLFHWSRFFCIDLSPIIDKLRFSSVNNASARESTKFNFSVDLLDFFKLSHAGEFNTSVFNMA